VVPVFVEGKISDIQMSMFAAEYILDFFVRDCTYIGFTYDIDTVNVKPPHTRYFFDFFDLLSENKAWIPLLSEWIPRLSKFGWPALFGKMICNIIKTPSVAFVVNMEKQGKLDDLMYSCYQHSLNGIHQEYWKDALRYLKETWPERVVSFISTVFKEEIPRSDFVSTHECPITMQGCTHPVIATDGHTYDRNAIMGYMTKSTHFISPITRESMELYLVNNYALR